MTITQCMYRTTVHVTHQCSLSSVSFSSSSTPLSTSSLPPKVASLTDMAYRPYVRQSTVSCKELRVRSSQTNLGCREVRSLGLLSSRRAAQLVHQALGVWLNQHHVIPMCARITTYDWILRTGSRFCNLIQNHVYC